MLCYTYHITQYNTIEKYKLYKNYIKLYRKNDNPEIYLSFYIKSIYLILFNYISVCFGIKRLYLKKFVLYVFINHVITAMYLYLIIINI